LSGRTKKPGGNIGSSRLKPIGAIYQRKGGKLERITVLDAENAGTVIWRINLETFHRAVGLYYGHCCARIEGSQVGEFGAVSASRGKQSDGGAVNRVAVAHTVRLARSSLVGLSPVKLRRKGRIGRPRPIPIIDIVDGVCWHDVPLAYIARRHGWPRSSSTKRRMRDALIAGLEAVDEVWQDAGVRLPRDMAEIEAG